MSPLPVPVPPPPVPSSPMYLTHVASEKSAKVGLAMGVSVCISARNLRELVGVREKPAPVALDA